MVLVELEEGSRAIATKPSLRARRRAREVMPEQLALFGQKPPMLEELEKLDIESLTPLEAITKLYELQKKAREG